MSLVQVHNDLFNGISKATTVEDMQRLETDVTGFYNDYKDTDTESADRIMKMYADKVHEMSSDNATTFDKLNEKLSKIKSREYDYSEDKDDAAAVQTRLLQLIGQLPKNKSAANASSIKNVINGAINSGVIGSKAVLQLVSYPAYADMVDEVQKLHAVEGSKTAAQRAIENYNKLEYEQVKNRCVEIYQSGSRLRRLEARIDKLQNSIQRAKNTPAPSYWG